MYPGSSGTVYFAQVTKDPLIEENKCILSNMHMDLESAKPEVRMASSSGNQFSMEFIEVENGGGRKWRIDNSIYEKFDGWVHYGSLWFTLKGLSSQVVVTELQCVVLKVLRVSSTRRPQMGILQLLTEPRKLWSKGSLCRYSFCTVHLDKPSHGVRVQD